MKLLLICLLLMGCSVKTDAAPTADALPDPDDPASFEPTYQAKRTLLARYRIDPIAGGKNLQAVSLEAEDGTSYVRAYRPLRSELQYADKRVRVTGRPYENSPYVQSVTGLHFEVESIELAPGETPHDPAPTGILTPPQARSAAEARAQAGWYATCHGTLSGAVFTFPDGSTLKADVPRPHVEVADGEVTLLAWVGEDGLFVRAGCPGDVPRCGVQEDQISEE